jgi:hypothetical protein
MTFRPFEGAGGGGGFDTMVAHRVRARRGDDCENERKERAPKSGERGPGKAPRSAAVGGQADQSAG